MSIKQKANHFFTLPGGRSVGCVPKVECRRLQCTRAVKEKRQIEERSVDGTGRTPDMNAALTSAQAVEQDEVSQKQNSARPSTNGNGKYMDRSPAKREILFGPSSRLANISATKKRKPAKSKQQSQGGPTQSQKSSLGNSGKEGSALEDFNPYTMGRRSRAMLETVWRKFASLSTPGRVSITSDDLDRMSGISSGDISDFETPQAAVTNVLVLGASGRVGRILVRKLLLRGYPVSVLLRPQTAAQISFPESVRVLEGDVGDYSSLRAAMEGVDKVIYCANPRTAMTAEVKRVCEDGVLTAAKALQDERHRGISTSSIGMQPFPTAKKRIAGGRQSDTATKRKSRWVDWKVLHVGQPQEGAGLSEKRVRRYSPAVLDRANLRVNKRNNVIFNGTLYGRSAFATAGMDVGKGLLEGSVALVVRVKGDSQNYGVLLTTEQGERWMARFGTNGAFQNVRLPFSAFRKVGGMAGQPQLDPGAVAQLALCIENRGRQPRSSGSNELAGLSDRSDREFSIELNRIQALPAGTESDFVLLSCAGQSSEDPLEQEKMTAFKRRGEAALRVSGLGYTVVRPGPIIEEPGGYKALVFDQGNRIRQSISRADVADVCLKSLHDSEARNKTFEVCHEYTPASGLEKYELVAHLPDKANSYLTPALATLEKET